MDDTPLVLPIVASLFTLVGLLALVIAFGPVLDWFSVYITSLGGPNPYASTYFMVAKFFYALVIIVAILSIVWIWRTVIAKVRYRRDQY